MESGWRKRPERARRVCQAQDDEGQGVVLLFMEDRAAMEERARGQRWPPHGPDVGWRGARSTNPLAAPRQRPAGRTSRDLPASELADHHGRRQRWRSFSGWSMT